MPESASTTNRREMGSLTPTDESEVASSRVFSVPSSAFGRVAATVMFGAILLVVIVNVVSEQGADDVPAWQSVVFVGALGGLLMGWVLGLIAVFRRRERSWLVLLPSALITVVVVNESIQGLLLLFGHGE